MVDLMPAEADTVSGRLHGESVLASVPRGILHHSGAPCDFCLAPGNLFLHSPSPFHIAILAFLCVLISLGVEL